MKVYKEDYQHSHAEVFMGRNRGGALRECLQCQGPNWPFRVWRQRSLHRSDWGGVKELTLEQSEKFRPIWTKAFSSDCFGSHMSGGRSGAGSTQFHYFGIIKGNGAQQMSFVYQGTTETSITCVNRHLVCEWVQSNSTKSTYSTLMEFMHLVFTHMSGESYRRWFRCLQLVSHVRRALLILFDCFKKKNWMNSPVSSCWLWI